MPARVMVVRSMMLRLNIACPRVVVKGVLSVCRNVAFGVAVNSESSALLGVCETSAR